jgi:hypothetical protein
LKRARRTTHPAQVQRPPDVEPIEGRVQSALQPVEMPRGFRETLRDNLRVAAQQHQTGLRVEYPRPIRQLVLLTVSLGIVVATVTTVLLARRNQGRSQS